MICRLLAEAPPRVPPFGMFEVFIDRKSVV